MTSFAKFAVVSFGLLLINTSVELIIRTPAQAHTKNAQTHSKSRSPDVISGHYVSADGDIFDVKLLSKSKIKYSINAFYPSANPPLSERPGGPNMGTAEGEAFLSGNTAVIKPEDTTECKITVKFLGKKLVIDQTGSDSDCNFGGNVSASGTYIKRSSRPKL